MDKKVRLYGVHSCVEDVHKTTMDGKHPRSGIGSLHLEEDVHNLGCPESKASAGMVECVDPNYEGFEEK